MTTHYDHKGKVFTDVVSKERIPVIVQTHDHQIHGTMHVRPQERLKDDLEQEERFLAITEAVIYDGAGKELRRTNFLVLNLAHIIWLTPVEELTAGDA